jgi:hypothetical protein
MAERDELLERYNAALRAYVVAYASLEGLIGPEFQAAYERAEEARAAFEKVRQELLDRQRGEGE